MNNINKIKAMTIFLFTEEIFLYIMYVRHWERDNTKDASDKNMNFKYILIKIKFI